MRTNAWLVVLVLIAALLALGCQKTEPAAPSAPSTAGKPSATAAAKPPAPPTTGMSAPTQSESAAAESTPAKPAATGEIVWLPYEKALEKARAENKLVMVDFTAEWCGWCKKLESEVYTQPSVRAKIDQFVPVMVDVDKQKDLAEQYNVEGMPYIAIVDADGNLLADQNGYCEAPQFEAFLDKGLAAKKK